MILYRLASKAFVRDLSGTGAMLYGGRWNKKGQRMLYTSGSLSLAALEIIANLSSAQINLNLYCLELELPDELLLTEPDLPEGWDAFPHSHVSVAIGSDFLKRDKFCLKVPSAIIPIEYNYLFNPLHPDFEKVKMLDARPFILDHRLVK